MFGDTPKNMKLLPYIKKMSFGNFSAEGIERGDILYFGYIGANRQDEIINPMIVFSGYDQVNNLIYGTNIRLFYTNKQISMGMSFLHRFEKIYWVTKEDPETRKPYKEKKLIPYTSPMSYTYEHLDIYQTMGKKIVNGKPQNINFLREYWRGYKPTSMKIILDNVLKVSNGNISLNIDVANAIINTAPKKVTLQKHLPDEGV